MTQTIINTIGKFIHRSKKGLFNIYKQKNWKWKTNKENTYQTRFVLVDPLGYHHHWFPPSKKEWKNITTMKEKTKTWANGSHHIRISMTCIQQHCKFSNCPLIPAFWKLHIQVNLNVAGAKMGEKEIEKFVGHYYKQMEVVDWE